jgi:hypothetical protein
LNKFQSAPPAHAEGKRGPFSLFAGVKAGPLRVRARLGGREPIHPEWFDDRTAPPAALFDRLGARFASFLPLLHSVRGVKIWQLGSHPEAGVTVSFRDEDRRCPRPTDMREGVRAAATGALVLANGVSGGGMIPYAALTANLTRQTSELRRSPYWPMTYCVRGQREEPVAEDNPAHAGVCWQRWPAPTGQGRLRWRWAAFLPLRQEGSLLCMTRTGCRNLCTFCFGTYPTKAVTGVAGVASALLLSFRQSPLDRRATGFWVSEKDLADRQQQGHRRAVSIRPSQGGLQLRE